MRARAREQKRVGCQAFCGWQFGVLLTCCQWTWGSLARARPTRMSRFAVVDTYWSQRHVGRPCVRSSSSSPLCPSPLCMIRNIWIEVYDQDLITRDDFLGKVSLPIDMMATWGKQKKVTVQLRDEQGNKGKNGSVCLSAEWQPMVTTSEFHHSGIIDVGVYAALNVPPLGPYARYWIKATCSELMDCAPKEPQTTEEQYGVKVHSRAEVDDGDVPLLHRLKEKKQMLQKKGFSHKEICEVLDLDPAETDLENFEVENLIGVHVARWRRSMQFLSKKADSAEITMTLMAQGSGQPKPLELGSFTPSHGWCSQKGWKRCTWLLQWECAAPGVANLDVLQDPVARPGGGCSCRKTWATNDLPHRCPGRHSQCDILVSKRSFLVARKNHFSRWDLTRLQSRVLRKKIVTACNALAKSSLHAVYCCIYSKSMWGCCDDSFHGWANFRMPVPTNGQCFWMCWSCWLLFLPPGETLKDFACKSGQLAVDQLAQICPNTSPIHWKKHHFI